VAVSPVLRHRDFNLYWFGVIFSQVGTRATVAATLYQVYELTRSTILTGMVGLAQAVALLVLSPLGGAYADRMDRRRLLQGAQAASLLVALALSLVTFAGRVEVWHILVAVLLTTAAATFDQPARLALIPAMVPRIELPQAFALLNPSRELAVLIGPALAGVLIAASGPGLVYGVDAATYAALVVVLGMLRIPSLRPQTRSNSIWHNIKEGAVFVRRRPLIVQLISLDLSATLFGAYRVVLPALAVDVLHVGPTGYGLLSAAPSAGALLATWTVFRVVGRSQRLGRVLLYATMGYGLATIFLAQAPVIVLALAAGALIGGFDAMATAIRQAAVQLETPDELRGRVSSIYQMASRGGPALGDVNIGWLAGVLGPAGGLSVGGVIPIAYAAAFVIRRGRVMRYRGAEPPPTTQSPAFEVDQVDQPAQAVGQVHQPAQTERKLTP
jgi:MFS family permease